MPLDTQRSDLTLGIVGTGIMGRGIAQIGAQAGVRVMLYDTRADAAPAAKDYVATTLAKLAEKGRVTPEAAARATGLLEIAHVLPHLSSCHLVIEAIVENLEAKRELFRNLEAGGRRRLPHRDQHVVAPGHRDRGRLPATRAGRRVSLLQPGAADEGGRGDRRAC